jgi:hypothetical protein
MASEVVEPKLMLKDELKILCEEILRSIVLDPAVRVHQVSVSEFTSTRFDSSQPRAYLIVRIDTNDASILRGAARSLKGSYKERIEGLLDTHAKRSDPLSSVHVEIRGPESNSVERLVPLADMLRTGRLSRSSPIVQTAEKYKIGYIQIRGRHLIAPSPAIAQFLEERTSAGSNKWKTVVDLFAGTAVATKVLCRLRSIKAVFVVDNDPVKIHNCELHVDDKRASFLTEDAMSYRFPGDTDLVVADPYYEDVERFLHVQLPAMAAQVATILLVPGNVEDRVWNERMSALVSKAGYVIHEYSLYGQVLIEATKKR